MVLGLIVLGGFGRTFSIASKGGRIQFDRYFLNVHNFIFKIKNNKGIRLLEFEIKMISPIEITFVKLIAPIPVREKCKFDFRSQTGSDLSTIHIYDLIDRIIMIIK